MDKDSRELMMENSKPPETEYGLRNSSVFIHMDEPQEKQMRETGVGDPDTVKNTFGHI